MLDVFTGDGWTVTELTAAINSTAYVPRRIGELNLFEAEGVRTLTVTLDEENDVLTLLQSAKRGAPPTFEPKTGRKSRSFPIPHFPHSDVVMADDVIGVRSFGTEEPDLVEKLVARKLVKLRRSHELTREYLRAGAIQGQVRDGDGTTVLLDLFTSFGVGETVVPFDLGTATTHIRSKCLEVADAIEEGLGDVVYDHIHVLCGREWFRTFIEHDEVKYAYQYFEQGAMLRNDPRKAFEFGGLLFEEYRGKVGRVPFIPSNVGRAFPVGVPDLFLERNAPANYKETVNTQGLPFYAKLLEMRGDVGTEIHTQSNPLLLCTRPRVLAKITL